MADRQAAPLGHKNPDYCIAVLVDAHCGRLEGVGFTVHRYLMRSEIPEIGCAAASFDRPAPARRTL